MYNVLVFGMTSNIGGIESFIMGYYRRFNKKKIHFDVLCNTDKEIAYENEIKGLGSKIFRISMRSKHPLNYKFELKRFFKKNAVNYDCIWVNVNSLANIDYLKMAKKYGIKRRIIHSHNSQNMDNKIRGLLHAHNRKIISNYATDFWACSSVAAKWFYNEKLMPKAQIIKNAIDLSRVKFDDKKRKEIRKKYNLQDSFVIGNIGRLHFQKNQLFALSLMPQLLKKKSNIKLVLIGDGPDKKNLIEKVKELNLTNNVIFTGIQQDVSGWLSSFDLFLFPSKFEGLSIALLEAQANGVPILSSDRVSPNEIKVNDNITFLDLNDSKNLWINEIQNKFNDDRLDSNVVYKNFKMSGYDINTEAKKLEKEFIK